MFDLLTRIVVSIVKLLPPHHEEIIVKREEVAMMLISLCEHVGKEQHYGANNARATACWKRGRPALPPCPEEGERDHAAGVLCHHGLQPSLRSLLTAYIRKAGDPGECNVVPTRPSPWPRQRKHVYGPAVMEGLIWVTHLSRDSVGRGSRQSYRSSCVP